MSRIRTNRVCFTINNYEEDTIKKMEEWFERDSRIHYGVCGQEIGQSGTGHLQGFINYDIDRKKGGIKFWKDLIPEGARAHIETARGNDEQNKEYCTKEGPYIETGKCQEEMGDKWSRVYQTAKTDIEAALSIDPEISIKYYNQIRKIHDDYNTQPMSAELKDLRDWQKKTLQLLEHQTERQILFIVDTEGGKGKSALAKHILTTKNSWACQGN